MSFSSWERKGAGMNIMLLDGWKWKGEKYLVKWLSGWMDYNFKGCFYASSLSSSFFYTFYWFYVATPIKYTQHLVLLQYSWYVSTTCNSLDKQMFHEIVSIRSHFFILHSFRNRIHIGKKINLSDWMIHFVRGRDKWKMVARTP